jgi:acyl-CoA thioesterase 11
MYRNETAVESNQVVGHSQVTQTPGMFYSLLLKWMDIAACVSAEKHAKMSCVTVAMDDLTFKRHHITPGNVVTVKAQVNRAFSSSMEVGVSASAEDINTGSKAQICQGFFTFVAITGIPRTKVQLPQVQIKTDEERKQHVLAYERRKIRLSCHDCLAKLNTV